MLLQRPVSERSHSTTERDSLGADKDRHTCLWCSDTAALARKISSGSSENSIELGILQLQFNFISDNPNNSPNPAVMIERDLESLTILVPRGLASSVLSAPRIATHWKVQHKKSAIYGLSRQSAHAQSQVWQF